MFVALQAAREELEDAKCSWVKINFAILFNVCQSTPGRFQKNAKISAIKQYVGGMRTVMVQRKQICVLYHSFAFYFKLGRMRILYIRAAFPLVAHVAELMRPSLWECVWNVRISCIG